MALQTKNKIEIGATSTTGSHGGVPSVSPSPMEKTLELARKKRKRKVRTMWIAVGSLAGLILIISLAFSGKEKPTIVQTETVGQHTVTEVVQATGKIQPEVMVKVSPEVPGEIIDLPYKEGAHVKKGDLVAKIKPLVFEEQFAAAEASYNSAESQAEEQKATMIQAEADLKRGKTLVAQHLLSDQDYDAEKAKYAAAVAGYNAANFSSKAAASQMRQIQESLNWTSVLAPMDGVITSLISRLGEKVVGTSQFAGTEMMDISDLTVMNAMVDVDENDVVNIKLGDPVKISIDAFPDTVFTGKVIEIANSATVAGTGTSDQSTNFTVKVRLDNFGTADLRPGMSCTARIETETKPNVIAVPLMAVTRRESDDQRAADSLRQIREANRGTFNGDQEASSIVFIVKNGKAKQVPITTGISDNAYVEVLGGLKGGEQVIKGNFRAVSKDLNDGMAVKVDNSGKTTE
ncbi:MAG TPA: efflux RND transporter periplasmic adaptor subunit [Candidatus Kapabacteria bacterium]|nr:efflux RND transporter periplasmic adaptor subunit [Candidatus Kapabacteria bacterium]